MGFYRSSHRISEEHGFAQSVLVLSSPSSINFTIKMVNTEGSAHSKFMMTVNVIVIIA